MSQIHPVSSAAHNGDKKNSLVESNGIRRAVLAILGKIMRRFRSVLQMQIAAMT